MNQCDLEQIGIMINAVVQPRDVNGQLLDGSIEHVANSDITALKTYALYSLRALRSVDLPNVVTLGNYAITNNSVLISVNLPKVAYVGFNQLANNTSLTTVNLDSWETSPVSGGDNTIFNGCTALTSLNLPKFRVGIRYATSGSGYKQGSVLGTQIKHLVLGTYDTFEADISSSAIESVNMPNCPTIGGYDFLYNSTALTLFTAPKLNQINSARNASSTYYGKLAKCSALVSISLPELHTLGSYTFADDVSLANVSLPALQTIGSYSFKGCTSLENITLPKAATLSGNVFNGCTALHEVTLGSSGFAVVSTSATTLAGISPTATVTFYVSDPTNVTLTGHDTNYGAPAGVTIQYEQA